MNSRRPRWWSAFQDALIVGLALDLILVGLYFLLGGKIISLLFVLGVVAIVGVAVAVFEETLRQLHGRDRS